MTIINVTIAGGSGDLGGKLVQAFLADDSYQVNVLSRVNSDSKGLDQLRKQGVSVITVDYNQFDELVKALQGTDILICTLHYAIVDELQPVLFRAAKAAGVRRVVPSDFSSENEAFQRLVCPDPAATERNIIEAQLEYTRYFCGAFYCYLTTSHVGVNLENRSVTVVGKGDKPFSLAHQEDLARFVAASLKDPRSRNARLGFESCTITFNELIAAIEKHSGIKLNVTRLPSDPSLDFSGEDIMREDVINNLFSYAADLEIAGPHKITNGICPSVHLTTLDTYLADFFSKKA
ncbi:hypothetical protein THASP1DRAFT_22370 [Thamnocephalis sphaerospora]|uniref:NmrA-like domain-containing protein n=1 Tax=Thamnocephalis sphaerospora TaxID=78915 RepID=A0A4P9XUD6_9FUNG|nr:hypothetical protein THASP1DRAFT_22370 [Thamnocephalis sphaerospora]|eukprot:RKP09823.1 hypothetical protein THASP1DRAFT_22370 [Thamnocephalis sphaerospora]